MGLQGSQGCTYIPSTKSTRLNNQFTSQFGRHTTRAPSRANTTSTAFRPFSLHAWLSCSEGPVRDAACSTLIRSSPPRQPSRELRYTLSFDAPKTTSSPANWSKREQSSFTPPCRLPRSPSTHSPGRHVRSTKSTTSPIARLAPLWRHSRRQSFLPARTNQSHQRLPTPGCVDL